LFSIITTEWLITNGLTTLDSAYCNSSLRHQFLEELKQFHNWKPSIISAKFYYGLFYKWVYARNLKLQYYRMDDDHFKNGKLLYEINVSNVVRIDAHGKDLLVVAIINSCQNLKELEISDTLISEILSILSDLTFLKLKSDNLLSYVAAMSVVIVKCSSLKEFIGAYTGKEDIDENLTKHLLKQNVNLTSYTGSGSCELLKHIVENSNITNLYFKMIGEINVNIFKQILLRNPIVADFYIDNSNYKPDDSEFEYSIDGKGKCLRLENIVCNNKIIELLSCVQDLTSLDLDRQICSVNVFESISTNYCHSLHSLCLTIDNSIYIDAIKQLIIKCSQLIELTLFTGLRNIGDVFEINPNNLEKISLYFNSYLFELSSLPKIIKYCPKLTSFYVSHVAIVDIDFVEFEQFLKTRNQLRVGRVIYFKGQSKEYCYQRE